MNELENQIKYLQVTNDEYYKGAIKWRHMYDKMRELFDNREIESPIVAQRNAEIDALKHMLERVEAEQKDTKVAVKALNKENDELVEELSAAQRKLNTLRGMIKTKLEIAKLFTDDEDVRMWSRFLMEVEE